MVIEVTVGPLSDWQKKDCLYCGKPAEVETSSTKEMGARLRSCASEACKTHAKREVEFFFANK